jgi:hypothetical protein
LRRCAGKHLESAEGQGLRWLAAVAAGRHREQDAVLEALPRSIVTQVHAPEHGRLSTDTALN